MFATVLVFGWPEAGALRRVAAGGPAVPVAPREQLAVGGGEVVGLQKLVRVPLVSCERYEEEELCEVRFVPLVGTRGAPTRDAARRRKAHVVVL